MRAPQWVVPDAVTTAGTDPPCAAGPACHLVLQAHLAVDQMAHDLNNVMASVLAALAPLEREQADGHPVSQATQQVRDAAQRGKDLVQAMLRQRREGRAAVSTFDLWPVLEDTALLLGPTLSHGQRIEVLAGEQPRQPVWAQVDETDARRALLNLARNAMQALQGRAGVIRLGASTLPGGRAEVCVCDDGVGMAPETLRQASQPYFTTRSDRGGSGLGLAMVHRFASDHSGVLRLDSQPGEGTQVRLDLPGLPQALPPAPDRAAGPAAATRPAPLPPPGSRGVLLYVDDDPVLRVLGELVFERHGFKVLLAESGEAALALVRARLAAGEAGFDCLVCDLHLPDMTGFEVHAAVRALIPVACSYFVSGGCTPALEATAAAAGALALVPKDKLCGFFDAAFGTASSTSAQGVCDPARCCA